MRTLRCPRCNRHYPYDRQRVGYAILCETPGCQAIIAVKPPVSPGLIIAIVGVCVALGVGYFYGHSLPTSPAPSAVAFVSHASPIPNAVPVVHKAQPERAATMAEVDALLRQKEAEEKRKAASRLAKRKAAFYYIPTQAEARAADPPPVLQVREVAPPPAVTLPTGTDVAPPLAADGKGELTVINGTAQDAVVKLAASVQDGGPLVAFRTVYVQAGQQFTMEQIGQGTYALFFALGTDWNQPTQSFLRDDTYSRFEKPLTFTETATRHETEEGARISTRYSTFTVTLNPVWNGKAKTNPTDKATFAALR